MQEVDLATHAVEILDLVFTNNCELLSSVLVESWDRFSDHKLVISNTTYQLGKSEMLLEQQDTVP